jgi:hypothetical protein
MCAGQYFSTLRLTAPLVSERRALRMAGELATVLYGLHLAIILYWFHDKTPDARGTRELVGYASDTLRYLRPAQRFPPAAQELSRLSDALWAVGTSQLGGP